MEEASAIKFQALRAKFQEEALLVQSKSTRPAVAQKPKNLPPAPGGHCSSLVNSVNVATENKSNMLPRLIFRDGLRASGGRRPISFPHQETCPPSPPHSGERRTGQGLKEGEEEELETVKEVFSQSKVKKKNVLLPFKSKVSKLNPEKVEEPAYTHLSTRPSSAPGELTSGETETSVDAVCHSDVSVTPPSAETSLGFMSTMERAKKKFSRRQMLISSKTKSLRSPSPVLLPPLACISARPFSRVNSWPPKPAAVLKHPSCWPPPKKTLPDLCSLALKPSKPPRPPLVDLSPLVKELLPDITQDVAVSEHVSNSNAVLDAPEFPDFENPNEEPSQAEAVDIAALDPEFLDSGALNSPPPAPTPTGVLEVAAPQSDTCNSAAASESPFAPDLNLGCLNGIPLDPASFPEPSNLTDFLTLDPVMASEDVMVPSALHLDETEGHSAPEETQLAFPDAAANEELDTHTSVHQQDYEGDNVYEDVENINKFILSQNLLRQKVSVKNPYADKHPVKEEVSLNIWPRNPWAAVSAEHSSANHVHSKERQSPNVAECKEQKKREKQRLEREKKEQKEREKKENEMKKKFKVTGGEEPMYHAKVKVASKVRKNDLPVTSGDTVSIIRTTNCPKGRWLARDANHKYGYISVMNVELNMKEMLELGKKAQAAGRAGNLEGDTISIGSRSSSHPVLTSSFTDDSEEWACEEEDTLSTTYDHHVVLPSSMAETSFCPLASTACQPPPLSQHTPSQETRHEALQKLAIFFQHHQEEFVDDGLATPTNADPPSFLCAVEEPPSFLCAVEEPPSFLCAVEEPPSFLCAVEEPPSFLCAVEEPPSFLCAVEEPPSFLCAVEEPPYPSRGPKVKSGGHQAGKLQELFLSPLGKRGTLLERGGASAEK
ncbi:uncharacterized protein LOC133552029 isoform X6 [Nerophis ophidion]|uniref:uncharacterized protein LOC133552029 isoform X6 n=1 Tax=Nerophis ophidion TaxID=159077 RepID=UPI002ADF5D51|nr:uncharacterized protein LOC133552029 isoform X6 [Nerophis ophidion]